MDGEEKNMATILNEFLDGKCGFKLDKKKLAEKLAGIIVSEIKSGATTKKQQFEVEADKVMKIINSSA
jgi:hypothetical protein